VPNFLCTGQVPFPANPSVSAHTGMVFEIPACISLEVAVFRLFSRMAGFSVHADNGEEAGRMVDLLVDSKKWLVQYLAIENGTWPSHHDFLVPSSAINAAGISTISLNVPLEQALFSPFLPGTAPEIVRTSEEMHEEDDISGLHTDTTGDGDHGSEARDGVSASARGNIILSCKNMLGFRLNTRDGESGSFDDFLVEDEEWVVRYGVIDTGSRFPSVNILLSTGWFSRVDRRSETIFIDLPKSAFAHAPEYDKDATLDREYEQRLFAYYDRKPYWA